MKNRGFTLVELMIVLAVIGVMISGILGANIMLKQAKLKSVISEFYDVSSAVSSFRSHYQSLPGDMKKAKSHWPECGHNARSCNGNGNGRIEITAKDSRENEAYRAWQHLALSQLYGGYYTGKALGNAFNGGRGGENLPASSYNAVSITLHTENKTRKHLVSFGTDIENDWSHGPAFTIADAMIIDDKVDDGQPIVGMLRATGEQCIDQAAGEYRQKSDSDEIACTLHFYF